MAEFFDLTGIDSADESEEVGDAGKSMIPATAEPCPASEANRANTILDHDLGRQLAYNPLVLSALHVPHYNSLYPEYPDIIKRIDWRKVKKFRKWEFDPNTIARDVLTSIGSSVGPGLNHHLQPLLRNSTNVNVDSDLATFRWDLVDHHLQPFPRDPTHVNVGPRGRSISVRPAPRQAITMPPGPEEQNQDAQNPPVRSPLKPTRGGAILGGFGGNGRPSNTLPSTGLGRHLPDTEFFRRTFDPTPDHGQSSLSGAWGAPRQQYDPRPQMQRPMISGGLVPTHHWNPQTPSYRSAYGSTSFGGFGLDGQLMSSPYHNPSPPQHTSTPVQQAKSSVSVALKPVTPVNFYGQNVMPSTVSRSLVESGSGSDAPSPASSSAPRRGRPPKSASFVKEVPSLTPQKRGRPFKNPEGTSYIDLNVKKRGRSLKAAESTARAAAAGSDSADGITKKRGRPFKVRTHLDIPVPEPVFIPFICEWKNCPAELHNLETLEAHVFNVHDKKQPSGKRLCLWGKCGVKHEPTDEATDPQTHDEPNEFRSKAEWKDHINQRHLIPFAWHMGDGPKGTSLSIKPGSDPFPWLKDKNGRQVTPSVQDQPIEEGRAKDNNARRFERKIDGIYWIYERIRSPEAYTKVQVQVLQTGNTSDGDDEEDAQMGESP